MCSVRLDGNGGGSASRRCRRRCRRGGGEEEEDDEVRACLALLRCRRLSRDVEDEVEVYLRRCRRRRLLGGEEEDEESSDEDLRRRRERLSGDRHRRFEMCFLLRERFLGDDLGVDADEEERANDACPVDTGLWRGDTKLAVAQASWRGVGDKARGTSSGSACLGGSEIGTSDRDSLSLRDSSKIGDGIGAGADSNCSVAPSSLTAFFFGCFAGLDAAVLEDGAFFFEGLSPSLF